MQPSAPGVFGSFDPQHPAVATDVVIFTIREARLVVLLVKRIRDPFQDYWGLPGGFVGIEEGLDECAKRTLKDETGVVGVYLEQLMSLGRPDRDPRGRVISVAYYALVPYNRLTVRADSHGETVAWYPVENLPPLAFDHGEIVGMANLRLAAKLEYSTIALQFMPKMFTLSQLQSVYETILGQPLDKRNFRKRLQTLHCIEETGEHFRAGKHRPAKLFCVKTPGTVQIIK
jgi:ADP-ribose pyrophosphatase